MGSKRSVREVATTAAAVTTAVAAALLAAPAARAEIVTVTATGHIVTGTDTAVVVVGGQPAQGAFSAAGGDLTGLSVTFGFTIDTDQGFGLPAANPYGGQLAGQVGGAADFAASPVSAYVVVNGVRLDVAGDALSRAGFAQPGPNPVAFVGALDAPLVSFFGSPYDVDPSHFLAVPFAQYMILNSIGLFGLGGAGFDPFAGQPVDVALQELSALVPLGQVTGNFDFESGNVGIVTDWLSPNWIDPNGGPDVHGIAVIDQLLVSPEPGPWALMILGFGGVGGALRARRREAPTARS